MTICERDLTCKARVAKFVVIKCAETARATETLGSGGIGV